MTVPGPNAAAEVTYAIDRAGRYVDADPVLLTATGYTLSEFQALVVGQLSTASPDAAGEGWRRFLEGKVQPRSAPVLVRRRDGRMIDAIFLGLEHDARADRWVVRLELVRAPDDHPGRAALATVLDDWRAAERRLSALADGDPMRAVVEAQVEELRNRYAAIQPSLPRVPAR